MSAPDGVASPPAFPPSSPSPAAASPPAVRVNAAQLMSALEQRCDLSRTQHFMRLLTRHCFAHCIKQPGLALSDAHRRCLDDCMDDLTAAHAYVTQTISQ